MRRRQVLSTLALTAASLVGCTAPGTPGTDDGTDTTATDTVTHTATTEPSSTETERPSTDAVTPDPDDPIAVVLYNELDSDQDVTLRITRDEETVFNRSVTVSPDQTPELDTGISEPGDYELEVRFADGTTSTFPFDVGAYELRSGSNLIVHIGGAGPDILIEE